MLALSGPLEKTTITFRPVKWRRILHGQQTGYCRVPHRRRRRWSHAAQHLRTVGGEQRWRAKGRGCRNRTLLCRRPRVSGRNQRSHPARIRSPIHIVAGVEEHEHIGAGYAERSSSLPDEAALESLVGRQRRLGVGTAGSWPRLRGRFRCLLRRWRFFSGMPSSVMAKSSDAGR